MTDLPYVPARTNRRPIQLSWIAVLYASGASAGTLGLIAAVGASGDTGAIEWQLVLLLRFMAVVKALMVIGAFALTHWRLRAAVSTPIAIGYIAALASMAIAPGFIWSMTHVVLGAACFHAGLLGFLGLAWKDGVEALQMRRA